MERHPKLELVIKAIQEAKKITPKGQLVKVYLPNVLKYKQFRLQELYDILRKLEDDEKILTIMHFPTGLLHIKDGWGKIHPPEEFDLSQEYFSVKVRRSFDKWCANYWKLTHQQTGSVKWTEKEVLEHARELRSPFEKLEKPNGEMPKKSAYQRAWKWIDTHRILSVIFALAALATIFGVIWSIFK